MQDVEKVYPDPTVGFETHSPDPYIGWEEWWRRHAKFARKSQPDAKKLGYGA